MSHEREQTRQLRRSGDGVCAGRSFCSARRRRPTLHPSYALANGCFIAKFRFKPEKLDAPCFHLETA
jgi:hypothetical protein